MESPVGAGLGIQPIGLTVLKRLGILNDILSHGAKIEHLHSLTREGKTVLDLKYADFVVKNITKKDGFKTYTIIIIMINTCGI